MVQIGRCDKVQLRSGTQQAGDEQVVDPPNLAETKAIAEEAYIYGLPIVMNYAVMHEFCIDKNPRQYKGSLNAITNETRFFTYKESLW